MKKIGLCICYNIKNYGSMLQAYATQLFIEKQNIDYEIIRYIKKHDLKFILISLIKLLNSNYRSALIRHFKQKCILFIKSDISKNIEKRKECFNKFQNEYFNNLSIICSNYQELLKIGNKFQAYLVGSDQLWLPAGLSTNFYNLNFTKNDAFRISYATSFGVSKIPFYQKKRTANYLNRIQALSVREQKGVEIVRKVAGKNAELVVDPTLLFTEKEWLDYIPCQKIINEPYIFVYFIGNNPEQRKAVINLKNKTKLKIVVLRHIDEYLSKDECFGDIAPYNVGPKEFVNLIRSAEYVCTDSFHGSVFSIINKKKFIVFNRFRENKKNSTNSRIDSLCNTLDLQERRYNPKNDLYSQIIKEFDYAFVENKLEMLRKDSKRFLINAFDVIKDS